MKNKFLLILALLGIFFLSSVYAEETFVPSYQINEFGNMVFNLDVNYYRTLDYTTTQTNYVRHMFGRITDTGTGLTFKNMEIYQLYLDTGIIYRNYITENIYLLALERFLQEYNLIVNEKQIIISNGEINAK
ncbi:MAG TPA: hypothetical protein P5098_00430 [Candidatus Dojkabacteria bacterium]|nr:hypothetical protein [Candidatus Dojkabacteria bacterium]